MAEGKTQLARMHVERTLELEQQLKSNQVQQAELGRLLSQVQEYSQSVGRASAMAQAIRGMGKLEKQMDLARVLI